MLQYKQVKRVAKQKVILIDRLSFKISINLLPVKKLVTIK